MIPVLFGPNDTNWTTNGIGRLVDAIDCTVTEARNGEYELLLEYPVDGQYFDQLQESAVILAVPADGKRPQPFRIYRLEKPLDGICTIYAEHISYQLNWIPVVPFQADTCAEALQGLVTYSAENNPFSVWTDKNVTASFKLKEPAAFRSILGGSQGSILDVYGKGEYEFDNYNVKLWLNRGVDTGVTIRYGKNLANLKQDENIENTYTGVCPYWMDGQTGEILLLPERVMWSDNADNYPYKRTKVVNFSERFETKPTVAALRAATAAYIQSNNIGVPNVNLDVEFVALWQMEGVSTGRPTASIVIPGATVTQTGYVENGVLHLLNATVNGDTIEDLAATVEGNTLKLQDSTLQGVDGYVDGETLFLNNGYVTVSYDDYTVLERINLCDTITVVYERLGVSAKAKVIKTVYDVLRDRYRSIEVGDARTDLSDIITDTAAETVNEAVTEQVSILQRYVDHQTELITGGLGGYVVINQNASGEPNEILILDQPTIASAVNLIRINNAGIGFSQNGYSGPYFNAWTIDGILNASAIGAGQMDATYIKAGTITADKLAAGSVTAVKIATGAITADKLAAGSVTADKLAAGTITADKLAAGSVTAVKIATGAITADKLAAGSVTADKLAVGSITADKISLYGKMSVYTDSTLATTGGYIGYMSGATQSGTTSGIGLMGPNSKNYVIATTAGVRITNGSGSQYAEFNISGGVGQFLGRAVYVQGDVTLNNNASTYSGTTYLNNLYINGTVTSALTVTGGVIAQAGLSVAGQLTANGALTAKSGLSVTGGITATGNISSSGTVSGAYVYGGTDGVARLYQTTDGGNLSLRRTSGVVGSWVSPFGFSIYDSSTNNRVVNLHAGGLYLFDSSGNVCAAFFQYNGNSAANFFNSSGEYKQINYAWVKKVNDYMDEHP